MAFGFDEFIESLAPDDGGDNELGKFVEGEASLVLELELEPGEGVLLAKLANACKTEVGSLEAAGPCGGLLVEELLPRRVTFSLNRTFFFGGVPGGVKDL